MSNSLTFERLSKMPKHEQIEIINDYIWKKNYSVVQMAEILGTYPNRIRRLANKLEQRLPNKSEAQKTALSTGRHKHPTEGKKREEDVKIRISEKLAESWQNMPDEERERRSDISRVNWEAKTEEEKRDFHKKANDAVRATAEHGSKVEKIILECLISNGYRVEVHKTHTLANEKLHLDLYIPAIKTAIEIDGPSHFLPIWSEEALKKTQDADSRKNGLVLGAGLCMIRLRVAKNLTQKKKRDFSKELIDILTAIKTEFPKTGDRLFIIGDK